MRKKNTQKFFVSCVLFGVIGLFGLFLFVGGSVFAKEHLLSRITVDGSILDQKIIEKIKNTNPLAEFTAIICVEDAQTKGLKILWSMDKTGGPDCVLNPPETGIFTEIKQNTFSLLLGGPSQAPLPEKLQYIDKNNLKVFIFVSVNDDDWKLITPSDYKLVHADAPTIPAEIHISYGENNSNPRVASR